jgi:hypothetical protein
MAQTTGIVQRISVIPSIAMACVWLGPSPANAALLFVLRDSTAPPHVGAAVNSMIDALTNAAVNRREVTAIHGDNSSRIDSLRIDPA